jgi:hypothetical protein
MTEMPPRRPCHGRGPEPLGHRSRRLERDARRGIREAGDRAKEELRIRYAEALHFAGEPRVPPSRCSMKPRRLLPGDQQEQVERVVELEAAELPRARLSVEQVAAVDGAAEASVR